jgi:hypothetical protein
MIGNGPWLTFDFNLLHSTWVHQPPGVGDIENKAGRAGGRKAQM